MRRDDVIAGRYRLVELIGHGGMGIVWPADDLEADRQVALKRPHGGGGVRAKLEREADVARRIGHPGAVEVYGVAGDGDDCWLVMEYFPSHSLAAMAPLPPHEVAAIGAQVAAAHAAEVVHRDVTPGNVLVGADGTAKVTDFGISAWRAATITSSGKISGTVAYVSPEVADGAGAKAPSDVFSLGATLFNAVEGTPPFGSGDARQEETSVGGPRGRGRGGGGAGGAGLGGVRAPLGARRGRPGADRAGRPAHGRPVRGCVGGSPHRVRRR